MKEPRVIYYSDELNDDFVQSSSSPKEIGADYKYINKNILWLICAFIVHKTVLLFAFFYCKLKFGHKIKNRKILKQYKKRGYYIYANHTQTAADAFIPSIVNFPKKPQVIVSPKNISKKGFSQLVIMLGAMPLPSTLGATRNFLSALDERIEKGSCIQIYPEAHIWPYYTDIRPFKSDSFRYAAKSNSPVFCFTNTYVKRKISKKPKIITYIDGPFLSDEDGITERQQHLRDQVFAKMKERAAASDCKYIKYIKK